MCPGTKPPTRVWKRLGDGAAAHPPPTLHPLSDTSGGLGRPDPVEQVSSGNILESNSHPPYPPPPEPWGGTNPEPKALHSSWLLGRAWPGKEADMPGIPKMHPCLSLCLLPQASRDSESRVGKESPAPTPPTYRKELLPQPQSSLEVSSTHP